MCAGVMFAKERSRFGGLGGELVAESTNVMEPINGAKHGGTLIASRAAGALCYNNHFVQRTTTVSRSSCRHKGFELLLL
jgi:hypothetical protein